MSDLVDFLFSTFPPIHLKESARKKPEVDRNQNFAGFELSKRKALQKLVRSYNMSTACFMNRYSVNETPPLILLA